MLSVSAIATPIKSDGNLTVNSKFFINSNIEFTEENQATLTAVNTEQNVNAVTLAQIRSLDLGQSEYNESIGITMYESIAKIVPMLHVEVGWQYSAVLYMN